MKRLVRSFLIKQSTGFNNFPTAALVRRSVCLVLPLYWVVGDEQLVIDPGREWDEDNKISESDVQPDKHHQLEHLVEFDSHPPIAQPTNNALS